MAMPPFSDTAPLDAEALIVRNHALLASATTTIPLVWSRLVGKGRTPWSLLIALGTFVVSIVCAAMLSPRAIYAAKGLARSRIRACRSG